MNLIGSPFIELESTSSTNIYATSKVHARLASHGTVYFAHEQTAGKGQRGRKWLSEPGANLTMTIVLEPRFLLPAQQFQLNIAISLGCWDFVKSLCGDETTIKWPNDLYWRDRKAGGILIENLLQGHEWHYAMAGIGINVNQVDFDKDIPNPISIRQITGQAYDCRHLAAQLCTAIQQRYEILLQGELAGLLEAYNLALFGKNQVRRFTSQGRSFAGIVESVNATGEITIMSDQALQFKHGELEWL